MATVLRQNGFSLMIYTRDHEPMHVHVWYQGGEAVIRLESEIEIIEVNGMSRSDTRRAFVIVAQNRDLLIEKWREIYG